MKTLRKTFFWLHLVVGIVVGLGVAFMAGTGILMAYEKPILERVERYDGNPTKPGQVAWSIEDLLRNVAEDVPDATPTAITAFADLNKPAMVQLGRERVVYVNNYTGQIVGEGAAGWREFFHTVEELHRWLAATGDWRNWGRHATGVVNLGFLVLIVSGLWLWWPKKLRWNAIKTITVPSLKLKGKPRDWNWHNAVGFWTLVPLLVMVLTGTIVSYPWANNLMYRLVGDTPPAPRQEGGPQQANAQQNGNRPQGGPGQRGQGGGGQQGLNLRGLNDAFANADTHAFQEKNGYHAITARLGGNRRGGGGNAEADNPNGVSLTVSYKNVNSPMHRETLVYDRRNGELLSRQTFGDQTIGRRLRTLVVPIHRGEILGITGMTIAAGSSLAALLLVYTGFALSYRRLVRPVLAKVRTKTPKPAGDAVANGPSPSLALGGE